MSNRNINVVNRRDATSHTRCAEPSCSGHEQAATAIGAKTRSGGPRKECG